MEVGGQRHDLAALSPAKRPYSRWVRDTLGRRDGLDGRRQEKISCHPTIEASIPQRVAIPTALSRSSSMGKHYVGNDCVAFLLEHHVCCETMYFFFHCAMFHFLQRAQCAPEDGYPSSFKVPRWVNKVYGYILVPFILIFFSPERWFVSILTSFELDIEIIKFPDSIQCRPTVWSLIDTCFIKLFIRTNFFCTMLCISNHFLIFPPTRFAFQWCRNASEWIVVRDLIRTILCINVGFNKWYYWAWCTVRTISRGVS